MFGRALLGSGFGAIRMKESSCRVYYILIVDACGLASVLMTYKGTMLVEEY